jgi:cytochrome P450
MQAYDAHRDEKIFPEADRIVPERWAPGQDTPEMRLSFLTFSAGPRNCVGA